MRKLTTARSEKIGDHVRIFLRGQVWNAEYCLDGKQHRKSLNTSSMKEARRKAIQLEADLATGSYVQESRAPSLAEVIQEYRSHLTTEGRAQTTLAKYERAFGMALDLCKELKVKSILGVNLRFMDRFRKQRVAGGAAPKTVHTDTVILKQLVNFAQKRHMIQRDPLLGLTIKKPKPTQQPCWTLAEVQRILTAVSERYRAPLTILADTGMRVGELQHLVWDDIDFEQGMLHIRAKPGWKPKTGDERVVPMTSEVRSVLEKLPKSSAWVFTAHRSKRFPEGGAKLSSRRLLEHLKRCLKGLGLKGHVHTFRHYFISAALIRGVPETHVRQWVGHVDAEIMKRYTHVADAESKAAMAQLDKTKLAEIASAQPWSQAP